MKVSLGNAFVGGAVLLGMLFGMAPHLLAQSALAALVHPKTISLAVVVCLILILSHSMEACGQMQRLLQRFQGLVRQPALNLTIFPAIIGLLPMPGGAVFSAPMVKHLGRQRGLSGARLSFINYWFRHIWEYWWPLYPGVLLATSIAGLNLWLFVLTLFPLTLVAVGAGFKPLADTLRKSSGNGLPQHKRPSLRPFLAELAPILMTIVLGIGAGALLASRLPENWTDISKEVGLILALIVAIGWVWFKNRFSGADRWKVLSNPELLKMFYMVAAILVFQGILQDSRAVNAVSRELIDWQIPLVPITIILPFIVGMVVGITIAFVGTTFPILITLVTTYGQGDVLPAYMMLAMTGGFIGVLLSPLHLCLLLSNEYFETGLRQVYRHMWVPCLILLAGGYIYFQMLGG
jgi:integral membrane protein (TIGR00529 family)